MADYIYLLQHRLTPTQRQALEAVRHAAREVGTPVFLVGGAVRDLTSGAPVRDLDFAVQGEVASLQPFLEVAKASLAGEDALFQSRYFIFPGGVRVEVGSTLSVSYPQPGQPEVQNATILDDLRRRDFTANAMAISLNEGSYGLLLDPLNGVADLENRELRLTSGLGFIEQPALLLRAARLISRMGWTLEERTQKRYENAKEEAAIERLPLTARGYETEEIFHEEDPIAVLEHLEAEGWLQILAPPLLGLKMDREALDRVRDVLGQMEQLGIFTDPSPVYFPLLTSRLSSDDLSAMKASFPRSGFVRQVDTMEARAKELASQMGSKLVALPSATWKLLMATEPEVLLALATTTRATALQSKFKAFFTEWPGMRQRIPHALLQEMRIAPEIAGYDQLLDDLFFALMDGKLNTTEEMRAFLEPYSPPAPVQAPTVRRRAAKSARGRGRQASAAAATPVEPELLDDEDANASSEAEDAELTKKPASLDREPDDSQYEAAPRATTSKVRPGTMAAKTATKGPEPSPDATAEPAQSAPGAAKPSKKGDSPNAAGQEKSAAAVHSKALEEPDQPKPPVTTGSKRKDANAGQVPKKSVGKVEIKQGPNSKEATEVSMPEPKKAPIKAVAAAPSKSTHAKVSTKTAVPLATNNAAARGKSVVAVKAPKSPAKATVSPSKAKTAVKATAVKLTSAKVAAPAKSVAAKRPGR